jgi:hypothetical protein
MGSVNCFRINYLESAIDEELVQIQRTKIEVWQKAEDTVTILEVGVTNDQQILSKFYALSDNFCQ